MSAKAHPSIALAKRILKEDSPTAVFNAISEIALNALSGRPIPVLPQKLHEALAAQLASCSEFFTSVECEEDEGPSCADMEREVDDMMRLYAVREVSPRVWCQWHHEHDGYPDYKGIISRKERFAIVKGNAVMLRCYVMDMLESGKTVERYKFKHIYVERSSLKLDALGRGLIRDFERDLNEMAEGEEE